MQSNDDRHEDAQLRGLLREWQVADAPPSLEQRVLKSCTPRRRAWWRFLFTGYIRVPVPLVYVLAALLTVAVWRVTAHAPTRPCVADAHSTTEGRASESRPASRCDHPLPGVC
jgi:hypothetical protein